MLSLIVVVHEYGHYKVAVLCGVKVLKFSVGFGRPIIGWQLHPFRWVSAKDLRDIEVRSKLENGNSNLNLNQNDNTNTVANEPVLKVSHVDLQQTLFLISSIPLGGYVKMLDERELPVSTEERAGSFNSKTLLERAAIVIAGPMANLVLAVLLYSTLNWVGQNQAAPIISSPPVGSIMEKAGFLSGDLITGIRYHPIENNNDLTQIQNSVEIPIRTFANFREALVEAKKGFQSQLSQTQSESRDFYSNPTPAMQTLEVSVLRGGRLTQSNKIEKLDDKSIQSNTVIQLTLNDWNLDERFDVEPQSQARAFESLGLTGPSREALISSVVPGGVAEKAGLLAGDLVLSINNVDVLDAQHFVQVIRNSAQIASSDDSLAQQNSGLSYVKSRDLTLKVNRIPEQTESPDPKGRIVDIILSPKVIQDGDKTIGRVDAIIGGSAQMVFVRYGFWQGLALSCQKTWDLASMSLRSFGQILVGQLSLRQLSGPLTLAEYAGKSAQAGWVNFVSFVAFVSVSVGVLNLLPIPVLDGGQLMYYLWECVTGRAPSEIWLQRLMRLGLVTLLLMMGVALINDGLRLFG